MGVLRNIIKDNKFTPEDIPAFEAKLFFEGDKRRINLERYIVLLFLAVVISTYGVIGDSVATVIGAMIIAPLMRPIMATTAGLIMGDMRRAVISFLTVVASVIGVIALAWLLTEINIATIISFETNTQITGRVSPRLIDLFAALAAGAAGAFAMSRDDVADSLPGVAIAISLVPPLCVVGIGLAEGEVGVAGGAMLLFLTNFFSILLAGGAVLGLLGLSTAATEGLRSAARKRAFLFIAIGILLVAIPLAGTTQEVYEQALIRRDTAQWAVEWLEGTEYSVSRVEVGGDQVNLIIYGSGDRPEPDNLDGQVFAGNDRIANLNIIVIPSEQASYELLKN
jgi:uncharacterized hydrophobic protein (TIGR00271 family)